MNVSVRSYLMAGAAAATATTLALGAVQATPDDIAVPAHSVYVEPQLSQVMVDLLAAASRMTAALPAPPALPQPRGIDTPTGAVAPAVAAPPGDVTVQNAASDFVTWAYLGIQNWVDWGVDYASDIAYWLGGWGVPFAGTIGAQIDIIYFTLIKPIADSVVFDLINPVLNAPLNLGVWVNGAVDVGYSVFASLVNTGLRELDYFFGWILPPLPPPLPIGLTETMASTLAAPMAAVGPVRSLIGDIVLPPVDFVTDAAINANNLLLSTSQSITGGVIDAIEPVFDALRLDFVNRQIDINYNLLNNLSIQEVGFVNDLISVPDNYLTDVLRNGEGPIRALGTQAQDVVDSALDHGSASVDAIGSYVQDQIDFFTPGLAATDAEVTSVPESTRALLKSAEGTADTTDKTEAKPARTLVKNVQDALDNATDKVDKTVADVKKAGDDVRQAVRDARDGATKTSEKASDKASEKAGETQSASEKTAKKVKAEKKAEKTAKSDKSDS